MARLPVFGGSITLLAESDELGRRRSLLEIMPSYIVYQLNSGLTERRQPAA
jgi:hypothetical protein